MSNSYYKISHNKNHFITFVSKKRKRFSSSKIKQLCQPDYLGADGFIQLSCRKKDYFEWDFYNCDGKKASFCGNAVIALGLLIHQEKLSLKKRFFLKTQFFQVEILVLKDKIRLKIPLFKKTAIKKLSLKGKNYPLVHSGTYHLLCPDEKSKTSKKALSLMEEVKKKYKIETNITYYSKNSKQMKVFCFEKGVFNWTACCGSAALALAFFFNQVKKNMSFHFPGGKLFCWMDEKNLFLEGKPEIIAEIKERK